MQKPEGLYKKLTDEYFAQSIHSAKEMQRRIENETARYHGYFVRTLYIPKMFTEDMVQYLRKSASVMYGILEKVIYQYKKSESYRKLFGFDKRLERLILRPSYYRPVLPMARLDIFFNEDDYSFKFCEFNTDGSSAMNEDKELNEVVSQTDTYKRFSKFYTIRTFELFNSWVKEFQSIYRTYSGAKKKPYVAIVDFFDDDITREFTNFHRTFIQNGMECEICDITKLKYAGGALMSPLGRKIDVVYRRAVTCDIMRRYDEVAPFVSAAENNDVCLIGDFQTQVVHNKIVFKILHDKKTSAFLTKEERQYVKEHIPFTVSLTAENVKKYDVVRDRKKWVIKPEDSYASRGVYAGVEDMTDSEWEKAVTDNIGNDYLLQEYCEPYSTLNIDLPHDENAQYKRYSNITGLYMYGGKLSGLYSRIAKNSIISTQYSEMSLPTIIVSEKNAARILLEEIDL